MHVDGLAQSASAMQQQTDSYQLLQAVLLQTDAAPPPSTPQAEAGPLKHLC
jgi:hypothetical protein